MSPLIVMLILAYSPLNWTFPWWLWGLAIGVNVCATLVQIDDRKKKR